MSERLIFDPVSEDITNAPLELTTADDDQIIGVTAHAYPAPQQDMQMAGSVDTEGEFVASRKHRNRQINLSVEIADPGLAAATNKATNPRALLGTTGWTNNSLVLMERQATLPAVLAQFDTAIHATGNADDDSAYLSAAVTNGVAETFTAWVYVVSGTVRLEVWTAGPANFASSANITTGSWQKIALAYTPNATATWTFRVAQNGAGTCEFYVTGMMIGPAYPYFDGDSLGCSWSGTRHASSSTRATSTARMNLALSQLQAKVAKVAREGGTLRRVLTTGEPITFDLHSADTFEPTFDVAYHAGGLAVVSITLQARPYGRGDEITLTDHVETTLPALTFTETLIKGDMPALGKLIVDNDQAATSQKTLLWGLESRDFVNSTIPLFVEAENATYVTPYSASTTAVAGPAGASGAGSNVLRNSTLATTEQICAYGRFQSVGIFNIYARVLAPVANAGVVSVRMSWGNIGVTAPISEDWVRLDTFWAGSWVLAKLGQVRARRQLLTPGAGDWFFTINAISTSAVGTDVINVDYFLVVPIAEGNGELVDESSPILTSATAPSGGAIITDRDAQRYGTSLGSLQGYDRPAKFEGDYLTVPPSGPEGRSVRFIVKMSRGVVQKAPGVSLSSVDAGIDDLSARLTYTPRYLVVPSA